MDELQRFTSVQKPHNLQTKRERNITDTKTQWWLNNWC